MIGHTLPLLTGLRRLPPLCYACIDTFRHPIRHDSARVEPEARACRTAPEDCPSGDSFYSLTNAGTACALLLSTTRGRSRSPVPAYILTTARGKRAAGCHGRHQRRHRQSMSASRKRPWRRQHARSTLTDGAPQMYLGVDLDEQAPHGAAVQSMAIVADDADVVFTGSRDATIKQWVVTETYDDDGRAVGRAFQCDATYRAHTDWVTGLVAVGDRRKPHRPVVVRAPAPD